MGFRFFGTTPQDVSDNLRARFGYTNSSKLQSATIRESEVCDKASIVLPSLTDPNTARYSEIQAHEATVTSGGPGSFNVQSPTVPDDSFWAVWRATGWGNTAIDTFIYLSCAKAVNAYHTHDVLADWPNATSQVMDVARLAGAKALPVEETLNAEKFIMPPGSHLYVQATATGINTISLDMLWMELKLGERSPF